MRDFLIIDPTGVLWRIAQNNAEVPGMGRRSELHGGNSLGQAVGNCRVRASPLH
jgi:hypothetical protein